MCIRDRVRVADDPAMLKLAMRNFLNKNSAKIAADLQDSLQGNMREIIGTLTLRAINTDRDSFSDQVMAKASKDMEKLGIEILSCNIQNVTDEHGLIQDLGRIILLRSARTLPLQRRRQNVILPLPRLLQIRLPMRQEFWQKQRLHRRIMNWLLKRRNYRRLLIPKRRKQTLLMRSRSRNSKRPSRLLLLTHRSPRRNVKQNCADRRLLYSSRHWKLRSIRKRMLTVMPLSRLLPLT